MKAFENLCLVTLRTPDTFVPNRESSYMTVACQSNLNRLLRTVSNGIREEILRHLLHCHRIASSNNPFLYRQANATAGTLG
jgi:hypothetical protein